MARLAAGDLDACIDLLRRARDEGDRRNEGKDLKGWLESSLIDDTSLDLLTGAELDFVEDLSGASFNMRNPNAASSCGCGMSFSLG